MNNNLPLEIEWNIIKFMRHPIIDALKIHMTEINKLDLSDDESDDYESYFNPYYKDVLKVINKAKRLRQKERDFKQRYINNPLAR